MLTILFGIPGVGKSFVGKMLAEEYGYHFYEADNDLTAAMIKAVQSGMLFTDAMREEFFAIVTNNLLQLQQKYPKIVMAQAMAKEKNRQHLLQAFPHAQFIWVDAASAIIEQRLKLRSDWVSFAYAEKVRRIFDVPQIPHAILNNNQEIKDLRLQLESHLQYVENTAETQRLLSEANKIYAIADSIRT